MENMTKTRADNQDCPSEDALDEFHSALAVLTGKWKGQILWRLVHGMHRFGELRRQIPGITQHMLTLQLRELEADGLVKRTVHAEVPPRVEYELTPSARALKPVFDELFRWSRQHRASNPAVGRGKRTVAGLGTVNRRQPM
jgi:DNA-binding HxlR family transcriptional regulator